TLEHLDNPRSFLKGVQQNMKDNGIFIFYVPSINRNSALTSGKDYVRFTNNLEHLLHFTPEFLQGAMQELFGTNVSIKEFDAGFGPYIVGAVSANSKLLRSFEKLLNAVQNETLTKDQAMAFNAAVIA